MSISLLHLSDLHLKEVDGDWCSEKIEEIFNLSTTHIDITTDIFICISGDIVYSGSLSEFEVAKEFLINLKVKLESKFKSVNIVTAPGNHDSLFPKEDDVREALIAAVYSGKNDNVKDGIVASCSEVQNNYFEFRESFEPSVVNRVSWSNVFDIDSKRIVFKVFNSSLFSTINDHKEGYGHLLIPSVDHLNEDDGDIVISMLHHPVNWLRQTNMHKMKMFLEKTSDLILTGHEHMPKSNKTIGNHRKENFYIAADIGKDNKNNLSFSIITFNDDELTLQIRRRSSSFQESDAIEYVRAINLDRYKYPLNSEYFAELKEMPASVTHHRKDRLNLDDVFVWPKLKPISQEDSGVDYDLLKPSKYLSELKGPGEKWIFADQYMGKSSLKKRLISEFNESGKFVLSIDANELTDRLTNRDKLFKFLNTKTQDHYNGVLFENTDFADRCLFIDNISISSYDYNEILNFTQLLTQMFNTVVVFSDISFRITELLNFEVSSAKQFEISNFTGSDRVNLVEQWLRVGLQKIESNHEYKVKNYIDILRQAIENNLIPQTPFYMLLLLNNAYALGGSGVDVSSSIALIDKMIQANLSTIPTVNFGQDGIPNFLRLFAYDYFKKGENSYTILDFEEFKNNYKERFKVPLKGNILEVFTSKRIFVTDQDLISFKDAYMYYYFLGAYISNHQAVDLEVENHLNNMIEKCYREDYSNILVFTSFFTPDLSIFTKVKDEATKILEKYSEVDLGSKVKDFFNKDMIERISLTINSTNDQVKGNIGSYTEKQQTMSEMEREHIHKSENGEEDNVVAKSFRFIQILGQMVKNRSGSLDGDLKENLIKEVISLSARLISFIFEVVSDRFEEHIEELVSRIEQQNSNNVKKEDIEKKIKRFFFYAFQFFTLNVIEKISFCAGVSIFRSPTPVLA